jgi:Argonaute linker 2 domain
MEEIQKKVVSLHWENDKTLGNFKLEINPSMVSVPARILPSPKLSGGVDMGGGASFEPQSGKWDLRGYRLKTVFLSKLPKLILSPRI